jgi:hypothetical protein
MPHKRIRLINCFLCRLCYNLAYQYQRQNTSCRQLNRLKSIGKRLGGSINIIEPMPVKPKGMHRSTYIRLLAQSHIMLLSVSQAISKHYKSQNNNDIYTNASSLSQWFAEELHHQRSPDCDKLSLE